MCIWLSRTWKSEFISHSAFVFVQSVRLHTKHQIQSENWIKTFDCTINFECLVNQAFRLFSFYVMTLVDHFERLKSCSLFGTNGTWSVHFNDSFVFLSQVRNNFSIKSCQRIYFASPTANFRPGKLCSGVNNSCRQLLTVLMHRTH